MSVYAMQAVTFAAVKVSGWFKVTTDGTWHLKVSETKGLYQCWGTRYEPAFSGDAKVYVDLVDASELACG